ncbi:plasminogen-like [Conger conger]|uniref:plasminogen-like n=1 Tax=Conger conger TaxID=82655 RepID=UPI002A59BE89|nr:plasminogen-like [Conger conger]
MLCPACQWHIMKLYISLLLCNLLSAVLAGALDEYNKIEGAWIFSLKKIQHTEATVLECATYCEKESTFTCRSFMYSEKDQECVIIPENSQTDTLKRRRGTALYEKKDFIRTCREGTGTDYRGTKSRTKSGKTCQKWAATFPHVPNMTPEKFPAAGLDSNFCRNPDGDASGPWCYTTNSSKRWESCDIPDCNEECIQCSGEDYRGKVSKTESGFTCQRWDSQKPHTHGYLPQVLPDKYLEENFCRNPDGEPRPWCFTTSPTKRWDFCSIPRCTSEPPTIMEELTCATGDGSAYRGTISETESGKTCQVWASQDPHKHSRTPENYPCKGLKSNYCRNPDNERMPWCYTTDPGTRWEYCKVPTCGNQPVPDDPGTGSQLDCYEGNGQSYRGVTTETISGKKCQAWSSMLPHRHDKLPKSFPDADLRMNLCRNPDGDVAPWCYTTDPSVRWEYCKVDKCATKPKPDTETVTKPDPKPTEATTTPEAKDCKTGNGADYRGPTSMTALGVTCQAWSAMTPHSHRSFTPTSHPDKGLESNQCRNPDGDVNGPWCYTMDPTKKWDYCQIQDCSGLKCGQAKVKPGKCYSRIVGGCESKPHSWPWQISLRTNSHQHFCGGTLIKPQWVVTAAHCLEKSTRPTAYKVYLGTHTEKADEASKQVRDVTKLILEPRKLDIALLKLDSPAIINDMVMPACLPEKDYIVPNMAECHVTGWGETQGTGGEGVLKQSGLPVIENKVCNRPAYLSGRVRDHEMCAGYIEGGTDSCQGDSGGPLVCHSDNTFILQGVTSWGLGCGNPMKPGVYTRVSKFVDWIAEEIKNNS